MQRETLKTKYQGEQADSYDTRREGTDLWLQQQAAVEAYLATFPPGTRVLDIPVGTGRFLSCYKARGFEVVGVDASSSMLERARAKGSGADLRVGDVFHLEFPSRSFDLVVCIRFFNWLNAGDFAQAFAEIARVAGGAIIANVKTFTPLAELRPGQALRQWKYRLKRGNGGDGVICHERQQVLKLMSGQQLALEGKTPAVPAWELARGIENVVYLMRRM